MSCAKVGACAWVNCCYIRCQFSKRTDHKILESPGMNEMATTTSNQHENEFDG